MHPTPSRAKPELEWKGALAQILLEKTVVQSDTKWEPQTALSGA